MAHPRVLSVGQCGFDHGSISRHLGRHFQAEVRGAETRDEALAELRSGTYDLVLVNRIANLDGAPGLDLIRAMKADPDLAGVPVMLVSNLPGSQAEAEALGALPGFGKAGLNEPKTIEALGAVLSRPGSESVP